MKTFGILALWASLLGGQAQATNIRVIGNGGGEAEMLTLSLLSQAKEFAKVCLISGNPCLLLEGQIRNLQTWVSKSEGLRDPQELLVWQEYQKEGLAPLTAVFLAQAGLVEEKTWNKLAFVTPEWSSLARVLFQETKILRRELVFYQTAEKSAKRIRVIQMEGRIERSLLFHDEGDGQLQNLTPDLERSLACGENPQIVRVGLNLLPTDSPSGFSSDLQFLCRGQRFRARFHGYKKTPENWVFETFAHESMALGCSESLGSPGKSPEKGE